MESEVVEDADLTSIAELGIYLPFVLSNVCTQLGIYRDFLYSRCALSLYIAKSICRDFLLY